jgi:hypothetical protein
MEVDISSRPAAFYAEGWNVDLLTWLLVVFGFGFAIPDAKAAASHELSPTELSDAQRVLSLVEP